MEGFRPKQNSTEDRLGPGVKFMEEFRPKQNSAEDRRGPAVKFMEGCRPKQNSTDDRQGPGAGPGPGPGLKCDECSRGFSNKTTLTSHVIMAHGPHTNHACSTCGQIFGSRWILYRHKKKEHKDQYLASKPARKNAIVCGKCASPMSTVPILCKHLRLVHGIPAEIDEFTLNNIGEFESWKQCVETSYGFQFVIKRGRLKPQNRKSARKNESYIIKTDYYICSKSGFLNNQGQRPSWSTSSGPSSSSTPPNLAHPQNFYCSAFAIVRELQNHKIHVTTCVNHYGHDDEDNSPKSAHEGQHGPIISDYPCAVETETIETRTDDVSDLLFYDQPDHMETYTGQNNGLKTEPIVNYNGSTCSLGEIIIKQCTSTFHTATIPPASGSGTSMDYTSGPQQQHNINNNNNGPKPHSTTSNPSPDLQTIIKECTTFINELVQRPSLPTVVGAQILEKLKEMKALCHNHWSSLTTPDEQQRIINESFQTSQANFEREPPQQKER